MADKVEKRGLVPPLTLTQQIVDDQGRPTPFFLQQWQEQRQVNVTVEDTTVSLNELVDDVAELFARKLIAGAGLTGGGDLTADRTFAIEATGVSPQTVGGAQTVPVLTINELGQITQVATATITGEVPESRRIDSGTGLQGGGDLSADRTLSLTDTGTSTGTFGDSTTVPVITIDAQGRITAVSTATISGGGEVPETRRIDTSGGIQGGGDLSQDRTHSLTDTGVSPGTYGDGSNIPQFTVDAKGRITNVTTVPVDTGGGGDEEVTLYTSLFNIEDNANYTNAGLGVEDMSTLTDSSTPWSIYAENGSATSGTADWLEFKGNLTNGGLWDQASFSNRKTGDPMIAFQLSSAFDDFALRHQGIIADGESIIFKTFVTGDFAISSWIIELSFNQASDTNPGANSFRGPRIVHDTSPELGIRNTSGQETAYNGLVAAQPFLLRATRRSGVIYPSWSKDGQVWNAVDTVDVTANSLGQMWLAFSANGGNDDAPAGLFIVDWIRHVANTDMIPW